MVAHSPRVAPGPAGHHTPCLPPPCTVGSQPGLKSLSRLQCAPSPALQEDLTRILIKKSLSDVYGGTWAADRAGERRGAGHEGQGEVLDGQQPQKCPTSLAPGTLAAQTRRSGSDEDEDRPHIPPPPTPSLPQTPPPPCPRRRPQVALGLRRRLHPVLGRRSRLLGRRGQRGGGGLRGRGARGHAPAGEPCSQVSCLCLEACRKACWTGRRLLTGQQQVAERRGGDAKDRAAGPHLGLNSYAHPPIRAPPHPSSPGHRNRCRLLSCRNQPWASRCASSSTIRPRPTPGATAASAAGAWRRCAAARRPGAACGLRVPARGRVPPARGQRPPRSRQRQLLRCRAMQRWSGCGRGSACRCSGTPTRSGRSGCACACTSSSPGWTPPEPPARTTHRGASKTAPATAAGAPCAGGACSRAAAPA
jgi:hypothetical protein